MRGVSWLPLSLLLGCLPSKAGFKYACQKDSDCAAIGMVCGAEQVCVSSSALGLDAKADISDTPQAAPDTRSETEVCIPQCGALPDIHDVPALADVLDTVDLPDVAEAKPEACAPACEGKSCGPDGCGGVCGVCPGAQDKCLEGNCVCQPACQQEQKCGDDGCGGNCGTCLTGEYACTDGKCVCPLGTCEGKVCGTDGCGGPCGTCGGNLACTAGECFEPQCLDGRCLVPAGPFWMGCNEALDTGCSCPGYDECDYHVVEVPEFLMGRTEVTVAEYESCEQAGACGKPDTASPGCNYGNINYKNYPVNCVTWDKAKQYCEWEGKPAGKERLCSEAEWEKAARGTSGQVYPWGMAEPTCALAIMHETGEVEAGCGSGGTMEVGSKAGGASPYGLLDLAGNVWEWVADCYEDSYGGAPLDGTPRAECTTFGGSKRVDRGGGLGDGPESLRSSYRGFEEPSLSVHYVGFRCCSSVTPQQ